ncbi:anti-sigma factor [Nonlabens ponticola]|uniref:Anti-sigma factor n=1 Tax=Nonlabens ponticola TaxID=2496866 RepID=A0A3S9MYC3_9FLAO|nr:anti-sigma factor [Nonlabens ponticola]AZQ44147.1 anti-sigma factor [Nonlabens ponticola]
MPKFSTQNDGRMMELTVNELIESGELEAYVCGVLPTKRCVEITQMVDQHIEVEEEVIRIENAYQTIARGVAPQLDGITMLENIRAYIKEHSQEHRVALWRQYLGWAAAILLFISAGFLYRSNTNLKEEIRGNVERNEFLDQELQQTEQLALDYQEALDFIKAPETVKVPLAGQAGFESSSAVAFHNPDLNITYIDIANLPAPPENMTYQLWSLTLNPLTPTDLGVLAYQEDAFAVENKFDTQAFGITLEPAGGSQGPTLERLYVLGALPTD